jgi:pyruvate ferredoxin oxidoreductase delta subunit
MKVPMAKPATSLENKTGSWRTTRPVLDKGKCTKCGICQMYCPENAISGPEKNPREMPAFDMDYCKGCGLCAQVCPVKAVKMVKEEK